MIEIARRLLGHSKHNTPQHYLTGLSREAAHYFPLLISVGQVHVEVPAMLGDRLETLTIHHGRHTFISHALAGHRTLAEVRDAAGHANVSITSAYLHVAVEDDGVGELFRFAGPVDR